MSLYARIPTRLAVAAFFTGAFALFSTAASAQDISFVFGSDPQYAFYSGAIKAARTDPTMRDAGILASKCTDCTKLVVIAGDLSHDGEGMSEYGDAYTRVTAMGVKIFDGAGNHDIGVYTKDQATFASALGVNRVPPFPAVDMPEAVIAPMRRAQGWSVFDSQQAMFDFGESDNETHDTTQKAPCAGFSNRDDRAAPAYCYAPLGFYYTYALKKPNSDTVGAYIVQLNNYLYSKTSVAYLRRIKAKLIAAGQQNVPVILVSHSIYGSAKNDFLTLASGMNIAAVLYGHYSCSPKPQGHCDLFDNAPGLLIGARLKFDDRQHMTNVHNIPIPNVNGDAMLQNILWIVSLDSAHGSIKFKRLDRGSMGDVSSYAPGTAAQLVAATATHGANLPLANGDFYVCKYTVTGTGNIC